MFAYPPPPALPAINSYGGEVNSVDEVRRARVYPCGSLTFLEEINHITISFSTYRYNYPYYLVIS